MKSSIMQSIREYLQTAHIAQLATSHNNTPWICTVYIVSDDEQNIYWLSYPERRHSKEIELNRHVSMAIAIKVDQPVIGLQIEGVASIVRDVSVVEKVMEQYVATHKGVGKGFYAKFVTGDNRHQLYKLTHSKTSLFDEVHFPGGTTIEWKQ